MKKYVTLVVFLLFTTTSFAGVVGWLTTDARDWTFIQQTGGIRIAQPVLREGTLQLPVEYDVSGLTRVTQTPTLINSALVVKEVKLTRTGSQLVLRVVTQGIESDPQIGHWHYVDLRNVPAGRYQVYYETAGDATKQLGTIEISSCPVAK